MKSEKLYDEYVKDIIKDLKDTFINYINYLSKYLKTNNKEFHNIVKTTNVMKGIQIILKNF